MYKKILLLLSIIVLGLVLFVFYTNIPTKKISISTKSVVKDDTKLIQTSHKAIKTVIPTVRKEVKNKKQIIKNTPPSRNELNLYESLTIEEAQLTSKARKSIEPIAAIQMNPQGLNKLKVKDTLLLPDVEGVDYPLTITHIQTNTDGSVTTTGSYSDEGITYTTTMTLSTDESFISLATAQGMYEIETKNGVGYVYKTEEIRKRLQRSSLDDVIILPIPQ